MASSKSVRPRKSQAYSLRVKEILADVEDIIDNIAEDAAKDRGSPTMEPQDADYVYDEIVSALFDGLDEVA